MTELLPLPVTSLFPIFLFPMLGVMKASDVCSSYVKVLALNVFVVSSLSFSWLLEPIDRITTHYNATLL